MEFKFLFENHPKYNLQPGDKIMVVDEKVGPVGIVFIQRKKEEGYNVNGIYSCKTGELLYSECEFDDIKVVKDTYRSGSERFYYKVIKGAYVGACSMDGYAVVGLEQEDITDFVDGVFVVKVNHREYAAYSEKGEELLPPLYTSMKRERPFIIAYGNDNIVSVIHAGKVLAYQEKATKLTKSWYYVVLHKEKSVMLISVRHVVKEFEGTARYRQGDCIEIENGEKTGIVYALDGSYVIPMGIYKSIRKKGDSFIAECADGTTVTGKIPW